MRVIPAFQGEFGLLVRYWVPQVHTICLREPCIVECEEGTEALFPAAIEHRIVERSTDHTERGGKGRPPDLGVSETRFRPVPRDFVLDSFPKGFDVTVCPRRLSYGESKNWDGWSDLVTSLQGHGLDVFAGGAPDSSADVPCLAAWNLSGRFLDATIEGMARSRLVIATDAGLAHLAMLCGAPLLLVTYRGLVAPGPVIDSSGRKARDSYWPAGHGPNGGPCRFESANHMRVPVVKVDGWEDPEKVAAKAAQMVHMLTAQEG